MGIWFGYERDCGSPIVSCVFVLSLRSMRDRDLLTQLARNAVYHSFDIRIKQYMGRMSINYAGLSNPAVWKLKH